MPNEERTGICLPDCKTYKSNRDFLVDQSEPGVLYGMTLDHRMKSTLGITGWSLSRVPIDGVVRHLDVDSSHPGAAHGPKGSGVHRLMRYVSWVKNVIFTFFCVFYSKDLNQFSLFGIILSFIPMELLFIFLFLKNIYFFYTLYNYNLYIYNNNI